MGRVPHRTHRSRSAVGRSARFDGRRESDLCLEDVLGGKDGPTIPHRPSVAGSRTFTVCPRNWGTEEVRRRTDPPSAYGFSNSAIPSRTGRRTKGYRYHTSRRPPLERSLYSGGLSRSSLVSSTPCPTESSSKIVRRNRSVESRSAVHQETSQVLRSTGRNAYK